MLHSKKISQRRVLLFDHIGGQGFRTMPSTESEPCRPPIPITPSLVDDMPSEQVVDIRRNEWTACFGIAGQHGPDYAMSLAPPARPPAPKADLSFATQMTPNT